MIKKYYKKIKGKTYGPYYSNIADGKSKHISRKEYQHIKLEREAELKHRNSMREFSKNLKGALKSNHSKALLEQCGYTVHGERTSISLKRFFTVEATQVRFAFLDKAVQEKIKSPEALLHLSQMAWKQHKRCNLMKQSNNFAGCLRLIMSEEYEKLDSTE